MTTNDDFRILQIKENEKLIKKLEQEILGGEASNLPDLRAKEMEIRQRNILLRQQINIVDLK